MAGGCSLPGAAKVLMPLEGYEGVVKFVFDILCDRGVNTCPPLLVGVGITGSIDVASTLSKRALMRAVLPAQIQLWASTSNRRPAIRPVSPWP